MKCVVEIEPRCPFINGKCIKDGWEYGSKIIHPCAFYDADAVYHGVNPEEPCKIIRAINRILSDEIPDQINDKPIEMPF